MLKNLLPLYCLMLFLLPFDAVALGLIEQELFVRLHPVEHQLEAQAVLTPTGKIAGWPGPIQLTPGARIDSVMVDGKAALFTFAKGVLQVAGGGARSTLAITYRARFDDPVPQDTVGIEDPSYGISATIMPEGTFLSTGSAWHPMPVGLTSRFQVTVTGPPGLIGVTSGRLLAIEGDDRESRTLWQTQPYSEGLTLAAGPYQVSREDLGDIQLLTFLSQDNAGLAKEYLASCREYLQLYQQLFGAYPYAKFAVVENFYPTGYGLPGWTLLGSSVIRLPFIRTTSLPHEIAHAWWGNAVQVDYQSGNWCEGLATYLADYYLKELRQPAEALEYRRKILRDYAALVDAGDDLPLSSFRGRTTRRDQAVGYGKAAMVFHMLRREIGDQAFWHGLQEVAREGKGRRYAWSDLQRHFEKVSGTSLGAFFQQWIDRTGAPRLKLSDVEVMPVGDRWQVSGILEQSEPVYHLVMPLRVTTSAGEFQQTVSLTGRQAGFTIQVHERPTSLAVDPDTTLFRQLYPEELPPTVNNLRASRAPLVVVTKGADDLLDASRDLLRGLQWQDAPLMSEADYLVEKPPGRDVLFLGWPQDASLQNVLPAGVSISSPKFTFGYTAYSAPGDVLFMVLGQAGNNKVTAYFLPGSVAAAKDTARRIPHYGRYSALVFRDGRNLVKSTWEVEKSPLKVLFTKENRP